MTRKDYVKFAEKIARIEDAESRKFSARMVCRIFAADNANFDRARFYLACGLDPAAQK